MEQVAQIDSMLEKLLLLGALQPLEQSISLLIDQYDPVHRTLGSFPAALPRLRHSSLHELLGLTLTLISEHFSTIEDLDDGLDAVIHISQDVLHSHDFHVDEGLNRVNNVQVLLRDVYLIERFLLVEIVPIVAKRGQRSRPFLFVESEFISANGSKLFELVDHGTTVEALHTSVDVGWEAEERRHVSVRNLLKHALEVSHVAALRYREHFREGLLTTQRRVIEHVLDVSTENSQVVGVVDTSTVNGILKDTINLLPLKVATLALLDDVEERQLACLDVTEGELVVLAPALRNVLASLLDESMEPREDEQKLRHHWHLLLNFLRWSNVLEGSHQVVLDTRRSLVGDLETRLQQDGWELGVRLGGKPEAEAFVWRQRLQLLLERR